MSACGSSTRKPFWSEWDRYGHSPQNRLSR
jgi:hypothetical protein